MSTSVSVKHISAHGDRSSKVVVHVMLDANRINQRLYNDLKSVMNLMTGVV